MHLVDRLLLVLMGLLVIGLITVVALVPETIITALEGIESLNLLVRLALVVVVNIVILLLVYLRVRVRSHPAVGLEVKAQGAVTDVSVESARTLILSAVKDVTGVTAADATVSAIGGRADVDLNVQVAGEDVHIPQKQKEINRALRQVMNKQLGLRMRGRPRVHISLEGEQAPPAKEAGSLPPRAPTSQDSLTALNELKEADTLVALDKAALKDEMTGAKPGQIVNQDRPKAHAIATETDVDDEWLDDLSERVENDSE